MGKIAIFFDVENMSSDYPIEVLIYYLTMKYGEIVLKKAYADLNTVSSNLRDIMKKESIELINVEHTKTKGQDVDKRIVEDAKKFALEEHPDVICIVSSDKDYINLVDDLHKLKIKTVVGVTTPASSSENIELVYDKLLKIKQLKALELVFNELKDEKTKKKTDGYVLAADIGREIKSKLKEIGFKKSFSLTDLLKSFPECFEIIDEKTGKMRIKLLDIESIQNKPSTDDSFVPTKEKMDYKERIAKLLPKLQEGLIEKDVAVSMALLCMLAQKSIFFFGSAEMAKNLIARRVFCAFKNNKLFDYIMNKLTRPQKDILGYNVNNKQRNNKKQANWQSTVDFILFDKITECSPAILSSLLTVLNEAQFLNEEGMIKRLIAIGDKLPEGEYGEERDIVKDFYDRFIMRLSIDDINYRDGDKFERLLNPIGSLEKIKIDDSLKFSSEDLEEIKKRAREVTIDDFITDILKFLGGIFIGNDRRWSSVAELLRICAVLNDRKDKVILSDLLIIKYCFADNYYYFEAKKSLNFEQGIYESIREYSQVMFYTKKYNELNKEIDFATQNNQSIYCSVVSHKDGRKRIGFELSNPNPKKESIFNHSLIKNDNENDKRQYNHWVHDIFFVDIDYINDEWGHNCWIIDNNNNICEIDWMQYRFDAKNKQVHFEIFDSMGYDSFSRSSYRKYKYFQSKMLIFKDNKNGIADIEPFTRSSFKDECNDVEGFLKIKKVKFQSQIKNVKNNRNVFFSDKCLDDLLNALKEVDANINELLDTVKKFKKRISSL